MKYENIDLIDALRRISDIHTEHYKEDFELDQKLIRDLAATHSAEDKHLPLCDGCISKVKAMTI